MTINLDEELHKASQEMRDAEEALLGMGFNENQMEADQEIHHVSDHSKLMGLRQIMAELTPKIDVTALAAAAYAAHQVLALS